MSGAKSRVSRIDGCLVFVFLPAAESSHTHTRAHAQTVHALYTLPPHLFHEEVYRPHFAEGAGGVGVGGGGGGGSGGGGRLLSDTAGSLEDCGVAREGGAELLKGEHLDLLFDLLRARRRRRNRREREGEWERA